MCMNILMEVGNFNQITPSRSLNLLYIILDIVFLLILVGLMLYYKKYETVLFGFFGGILYTIVDYGGFYLLAHSRSIYINGELADSLNTFWVLLWMSMSYGFTNFAYIWLCLAKDKKLPLWIILIFGWWLIAPSISKLGGPATIFTTRTSNEYHSYMAIILVISYVLLISIMSYKRKEFVNLIILNIIGITAQFGWEFALLINGIRPFNNMSIRTICVNSLMETNLGMPLILLIFYRIRSKYSENLKKVDDELVLRDLGIIKV